VKGIRGGGIIDPKDMREAKHHIDGLNQEIGKLTRLFDAATGRANKFQNQIDHLTDDIQKLHKVGGQEIMIQKKESQIDALAQRMNNNDDLAAAYKKEIDRLKAMLGHQQDRIGGFKEGEEAQSKGAAGRPGPRQTLGGALTSWMPDWMKRYGGQALGLLGAYSAYQHLQTGLNTSANLHKMAADLGIRENMRSPENFDALRESLYKSGYPLGFKGLESMGMASTMQALMGYTEADSLKATERFTRAFGLEGGETSQFFGRSYQQGAFGYGPQNLQKYAEVTASYLDRSKMQGRAVEAMEATAQILEKWAGRNPGLLDSTGLMAVQTLFNQTGLEGFRGARGAQFLSMLDQSIASPSNPAVEHGLLTAFGWGKGQSYFGAVNRLEDGASPENLRDAMKYIRGNYGGDEEQMLLALRGFFPGLSVKQGKALMGVDFNSLDAIRGALDMDGGRIDSKVDNWTQSQGGQLYLLDARTDELQTLVGDKLIPSLSDLQKVLQDVVDWGIAHPTLAIGGMAAGAALWNMPMGGGGGGMPGAPGAPGMPGAPGGGVGGGGGGNWLTNMLGIAGGQAVWAGGRAAGTGIWGALTGGGASVAGLGTAAAVAAPLAIAGVGLYAANKMDEAAEMTRIRKGAKGWFNLKDDVGMLRGFGGADGSPDMKLFEQLQMMQGLFTGDIKGIESAPQEQALKNFQEAMMSQARYNIMKGSNTLFGTDDPLSYLRQNGLDDIIAGHLEAFLPPGAFTAGLQQNQFYVNQEQLRNSKLFSNGGTGFIANRMTLANSDLFGFTAKKLDDLNNMALSSGIDPKLLLAILQHEGTGSFNTLSPTRLAQYHSQGKYLSVTAASDGGHGANPVWAEDLLLAVNLIKDEQTKWNQMTKEQQAQYGDFLAFVNKRYAQDPNWSKGVRDILETMGGDPSKLFFNPGDAYKVDASDMPKGWTWDRDRLARDQEVFNATGVIGPAVPEMRKLTIDEEQLADAMYKAQQAYRAGERAVTISGTATINVKVDGKEMDPRAEALLERRLREEVRRTMEQAKYEETFTGPRSGAQASQW
jgi:hypothetical protein